MINQLLLISLGLLFGIMTIGFLVAYRRQRFDTVDLFWGFSFMAVAWLVALRQPSFRSFAIMIMVTMWGYRLIAHIYQRSRTKPDDPRYDTFKRKWRGNIWRRAYLSIFLLQGGLVWLISLPIVMAANPLLDGWGWLTWLGLLIWAVGFTIESRADAQLARFVQSKRRSTVLQTGLWRFSRHPNYFGELLQWWAIGLIVLQVSWGWLGLLGPLLLTYLIVYVSGIPPIEQRRQHDVDYQAYKRRTSPLILWPPQKQ